MSTDDLCEIRPAVPAEPDIQPPSSHLANRQARDRNSRSRSRLLGGALGRRAQSVTSALRPVWARLASNTGVAMAPQPGPGAAHVSESHPPSERKSTSTAPASTGRAGNNNNNDNDNDNNNNRDVGDENILEVPQDDLGDGDHSHATEKQPGPTPAKRPKSPAYVAPIPKIGSIPTIPSVGGGGGGGGPGAGSGSGSGIPKPPPARRLQLTPEAGELLVGKPVNEDGEIVDPATGAVLARVSGDLPELVGRTVANRHGDIFGDRGEFLGFVAELAGPEDKNKEEKQAPRSLVDVMGHGTASLMVDGEGNILDASGAIVGQFHDNNNPMHRKLREERERAREAQQKDQAGPTSKEAPVPDSGFDSGVSAGNEPGEGPEGASQQPRPRRTEEERRENAESWRKEKPVFNGQQRMPNITFS